MKIIVGARIVIHEQVFGHVIRVSCDDISFTGVKSIPKWKAPSFSCCLLKQRDRGERRE